MSGEDEAEMRARAREERHGIVEKYDKGREEGAVIDDWEDPRLEIYHSQDRLVSRIGKLSIFVKPSPEGFIVFNKRFIFYFL